MHTFKALAALLSFPTHDLVASLPQLEDTLRGEGAVRGTVLVNLLELIRELGDDSLFDAQERHVALFGRSSGLSLHLFEHVPDQSRGRGQAMIDLRDLYRDAGLAIARVELPDYLPMFLEYLSCLDRDAAQRTLGDIAPVLTAIQERLARRGSAYAAVFAALVRLAQYLSPEPAPSDTAQRLDRSWNNNAAAFGPAGLFAGDICARASTMVARVKARTWAGA